MTHTVGSAFLQQSGGSVEAQVRAVTTNPQHPHDFTTYPLLTQQQPLLRPSSPRQPSTPTTDTTSDAYSDTCEQSSRPVNQDLPGSCGWGALVGPFDELAVGERRPRAAGLAMAFKLIESAQRRWRAVNGAHMVALVRAGATFIDGKLVERPTESPVPTAA